MINVTLGIDSATYQDGNTVNLSAYATAIAKLVRPRFPELKFRFTAIEDDNAETKIEFNNDKIEYSALADEIRSAVQDAEGETYSDESVWNN